MSEPLQGSGFHVPSGDAEVPSHRAATGINEKTHVGCMMGTLQVFNNIA